MNASLKKVLCFLLAVAMCATLVACGSTDDTVTTTTAGDTVTTTTVGDDDTTTTVEGEDTTTAEGEDTTTVEGEDVITTVEDEVTTTVEDEVTTTIKDKTTTKDKVTTTKNKVTTTKNKVTTTKNKVTTTTKNKATTTTTKKVNNDSAISGGVLGESDNSGKGLTRDEVIAKMPANLKNTKIVYFYWHNPHERMEGSALKEFQQKTGIELVYEESSANAFYDELTARVTAGNSPDMVRNRFTSVYALAGLQPVENSGFDFSDPEWDRSIMSAYTVNGKCYGINIRNSAILDVRVMYYNRRALKATSGLEDPYELWKKGEWTWDKFWEMCEAFVASKRGASGYYGAAFEYQNAYAATRSKDYIYFDATTNKYVNNMKDPDIITAWTITKEKYDQGILVFGDRLTDFDEGKILFFSSGPFSCRTLDPRQKVLKVKKNLGTVPMPTDETTKYTQLYEVTAFGIPMGAKNAAAVPYLVRYITDQASYDMSEVYCDENALTSVNEMISRGNFIVSHVAGHITGWADNPVTVDLLSDNLKTELDSKSPAVDAAIEEANNRLQTLGQA